MRVAVVGAGIGGLSSALSLARLGFVVDIFELSPDLGGKLLIRHDNLAKPARFLPVSVAISQESHEFLKSLSFDGVGPEVSNIETPSDTFVFPDGRSWALPQCPDGVSEALTSLGVSHLESQAFFQLLGMGWKKGYQTTAWHLGARMRTWNASLDRQLQTPQLKEVCLAWAANLGLHPERCGALWPAQSLAQKLKGTNLVGVSGGSQGLLTFLETACTSAGIKIHYNAQVTLAEPMGRDTRNRGWLLTLQGSQEQKRFDAVVVNGDPHRALFEWLDAPALQREWLRGLAWNTVRPSESRCVVVLERETDESCPARLTLLPPSCLQTLRQVHDAQMIPDDPLLWAWWPHAFDASICKRVVCIAAQVPSLESGHNWDAGQTRPVVDRILETSAKQWYGTCAGRVLDVITPMDFHRGGVGHRGGLFTPVPKRFFPGLSPYGRASTIPNLAFVGDCVAPGEGIDGVLRCAALISGQLGVP